MEVYVDCTFGGGGHSLEILKHLDANGRMVVFDQDADARKNVPNDDRIIFVPHNFRHLQRFCRLHKITQVDGILADLESAATSSIPPTAGSAPVSEGDLDMRMDQRQDLTAFDSGEHLHRTAIAQIV